MRFSGSDRLPLHPGGQRLVLRAIDDGHAAPAERAENPVPLHRLVAESVTDALTEPLRDEAREDAAELEMT